MKISIRHVEMTEGLGIGNSAKMGRQWDFGRGAVLTHRK
jgi:hypothetical protein